MYRNLTPRQRELIEEFAREEQGEYDKRAAAGASGWRGDQNDFSFLIINPKLFLYDSDKDQKLDY